MLRPDPRNPKAHDLETIDASVGRFGIIDTIATDGRTGYIVSGHGRTKTLTAMKARGESPPEGVILDKDGEWLVPVAVGWSSRTDAEAAAALIALNRTTELGGWVDESLLALLDELGDDLDGVGFTEADREALAHLLNDDNERDLDALAEKFGDGPSDSDHLIRVVLTLSRPLAARLTDRVGETPETQEIAVRELLGTEK